MQKTPVTPRSLDDRMLDFALVTLRNAGPWIARLGMKARATWAAGHVATVARLGGDVVSEESERRLALSVYGIAVADMETYG